MKKLQPMLTAGRGVISKGGVRIAIIDYGMGNIGSVAKACVYFGAEVKIAKGSKDLEGVDKIILPGVGAFGDAMRQLKKMDLAETIKEKISQGIHFLGICLGMQLLLDKSQESINTKGLGIFRGEVVRFRGKNIKIPHIGWNTISLKCRMRDAEIFKNVQDNSYVYFCHSYYVAPQDRTIVAAVTDYGIKFASIIAKDNIFGIQFHPEKSQRVGLKILENFIKL